MTYANLHTTAALMRAKELDVLAVYTADADVIALKETQAKEEMKWDLQEALNLEYDATDFETYLTNNQSYLQEALANKQLALFFFEDTGALGSANDMKVKHYKGQYESMRARFASLKSFDVQQFTTVNIVR
jgi:hypothetical protein